jgi:hypothetical protein
MTAVHRFIRLDTADRRLVLQCWCALALMCVALRIFSVRRLGALVAREAGWRVLPASRRRPAKRIAWGIGAAARYVPGATCLCQALAARLMLGRHGHPARLRVGVAMLDGQRLEGHAWVEDAAGMVLAGGDVTRYMPLESSAGPKGSGLPG